MQSIIFVIFFYFDLIDLMQFYCIHFIAFHISTNLENTSHRGRYLLNLNNSVLSTRNTSLEEQFSHTRATSLRASCWNVAFDTWRLSNLGRIPRVESGLEILPAARAIWILVISGNSHCNKNLSIKLTFELLIVYLEGKSWLWSLITRVQTSREGSCPES